jgi:hypothetical protein
LEVPANFWRTTKLKKIIDIFDEARQKALNQRKTFRVEINKTKKELRLIDEGDDASTANDDKILKKIPAFQSSRYRFCAEQYIRRSDGDFTDSGSVLRYKRLSIK